MAAKIKMADLVLMLRCIRCNTVYMYVQFGVDGKVYVEVISYNLMLYGEEKKMVCNVMPTRYARDESF